MPIPNFDHNNVLPPHLGNKSVPKLQIQNTQSGAVWKGVTSNYNLYLNSHCELYIINYLMFNQYFFNIC